MNTPVTHASLVAVNAVKYKAQGYTYRLVIDLHHQRTGKYVRSVVFYVRRAPTLERIGALTLKNGGSIVDSSYTVNVL